MTSHEILIAKIAVLILLGTLLGALVFPVAAQEAQLRDWGTGGWQPRNTGLALMSFGARYYDAKIAKECLSVSPYCREVGPIANVMYGERPNANEIYKFQSLMFAIEQFIAYKISPPFRETWQIVLIVNEIRVINDNKLVADGMRNSGISVERPNPRVPLTAFGIGVIWLFK